MIKRNNVFIHILILALISLAICDNGSASAASKNGNNVTCINIQCNCTHTSVSEKCCCYTQNKTYEQYQQKTENTEGSFSLTIRCIRCADVDAFHIGSPIILKYIQLDKIQQISNQFIYFFTENTTTFILETDLSPPKKPPRSRTL